MKIKLMVLSLLSFIADSYSQKVDTLDLPYTKYSSSTTEQVSKYGRMFTIYKLGYPMKVDSSYIFIYEEVSKEAYDAYHKRTLDFGTCTPCWQRVYRENGKLYYEGLMFTDCPIGIFKRYDPEGFLVEIQNYKMGEQTTRCNTKDGDWIYFHNGKKTKTEIYISDSLVQTIIH